MRVSSLSWDSTLSEILRASDREIVDYCETAPTISDNVYNVRRLTEYMDVKIGMEIGREYHNQLLIWQLVKGTGLRVPEPLHLVESIDRDGITTGYLIMEHIQGITLEHYDFDHRCDIIAKVANAIHLLHTTIIRTMKHHQPGPPFGGPAKGFPWGENGTEIELQSLSDLERCVNRRLKHYAKYQRKLGWSTPGISLQHQDLVPCHLDLAPRNVILTDDGSIGLLDWGTLGYYPAAFELAALLHQQTIAEGTQRLYFEKLTKHLRSSNPDLEQELLDKLELTQRGSIHYGF